MRLRTFESFWLVKNGLLHSYPSLQENIERELIVIGGGITGALISNALLDEGYGVLMLDRRDIGQGSTAATTSMLQYEIDVPMYKLAEKIGEEGASICYRSGIAAIKDLESLVAKTGIDCGFANKQSLYVAHDKKSAAWLKKEFEFRNKHRLGVEWLDSGQLSDEYGLQTSGGILSHAAASIDAYKFAHELIAKNTKRGLTVFDQTEIRNFDFKTKGVELTFENGYKAKCKKIIFCSGYETLDIIKEKIADLFSTFACVSEQGIQLNENLTNTLLWDTNDPYFYMRTTDDGRLLIGGEDSKFNISALRQFRKSRKSGKLKKRLGKLIPGINFIQDFSWAGTFGSTKDGLPYIGKHPRFKNALFVLGFGGNGITFSIQGMQLVKDILKSKKNPLLNYYKFGR